jgi:hypothetical protein
MLASRAESLPDPQLRELVIAIDFDGCIFHRTFLSSQSPNRAIEENEKFIQHVVGLIKSGKYRRATFMVASSRQSKPIDDLNSQGKGSCYPVLVQLCNEIQRRTDFPCEVDGYLLADTYGTVTPGENFSKALNKENYPYSNFVWDERKYSIAYGQMHKKASDFEGRQFDYHFYDDRGEDVLGSLLSFYNQNIELTPGNGHARFYQYEGNEVKAFQYQCLNEKYDYEFQGKGVIDRFYQENIRFMALCAGFDPKLLGQLGYSNSGISGSLYGDYLMKFINNRKLRAQDVCYELNAEIEKVAATFRSGYDKKEYQDFIHSLKHLYKEIVREIGYQERHSRPAEEMDASEAVLIARETLKMLRSFKDENIHNKDYFDFQRHKILVTYVNKFGQPMDFMKQSARLFSNTFYSMFNTSSRVSIAAYQFAEMIKPLLYTDTVEHAKLDERKENEWNDRQERYRMK